MTGSPSKRWKHGVRRLGGWLFACSWLGCAISAEPTPRHAPLVCDPDAGDHVAFGLQDAGEFFEPTGQRYGWHFLIIDGSCRWFAARSDVDAHARAGAVRTGILDAATLAALNTDLLTGPWPRVDAQFRAWGGSDAGSDASTLSLWRDELGASCYSHCSFDSDELGSLLAIARDWEQRLAERGAPFDGPVRLVWASAPTPLAGAREWTGMTDLAAELGDGYYGELVVTDVADAATLRAWRLESAPNLAVPLRVEERSYTVYVIDAIPHADATGHLRPPASLRE